jgi:hypothetical protein
MLTRLRSIIEFSNCLANLLSDQFYSERRRPVDRRVRSGKSTRANGMLRLKEMVQARCVTVLKVSACPVFHYKFLSILALLVLTFYHLQ